jgi:hypothetical protein
VRYEYAEFRAGVVRRAEAGQAVGGKAIAPRKNDDAPKWQQSARKHQTLVSAFHSPRGDARQALGQARLALRWAVGGCDGMRVVRRGTAIFFRAHVEKRAKVREIEVKSLPCMQLHRAQKRARVRAFARNYAHLRAGALVLKSPTRKLTHPARHARIRLAIRRIPVAIRAFARDWCALGCGPFLALYPGHALRCAQGVPPTIQLRACHREFNSGGCVPLSAERLQPVQTAAWAKSTTKNRFPLCTTRCPSASSRGFRLAMPPGYLAFSSPPAFRVRQ